MSKHVGARTHASAVRAQHASRIAAGNAFRLAAAGLLVALTLGSGALAQADEGGGVVPGGTTGEPAGQEAAPPTGQEVAPREAPGHGVVELSATSSDTGTVTRVVVTPGGTWTTTVEPSTDAREAASAPGVAAVRR